MQSKLKGKNMFKFIFVFCILFIVSCSSSNTFFVIEDTMSLTCKDIEKVNKFKEKSIFLTYNKKGSEKFKKLTKKSNIGKNLGLIINDKVIFFNLKIRGTLGESNFNKILLSAKKKEDLELLFNHFNNCKLN